MAAVNPEAEHSLHSQLVLSASQRELPGHIVAEVNYTGNRRAITCSTSTTPNRFVGDMLDNRYDGINPSFGGIRLLEGGD